MQYINEDNASFPDVFMDALSFREAVSSPSFENSGPFSIAENPSNGAAVGDVDANDGSGGATDANITYSITGGNSSPDGDGTSAFAIDANSGALTVNDASDFDHETTASFSLDVQADNGSTTATQAYTVSVTDVNEAPTVSLASTSTSIDENNSPPTVLTSITINDPDGGTNDLSLSGTDAGSFAINGSNELEFTATADFETKSSYSVTVEVNDSGVGSDPNDSETFSLSITDVNEAPAVATNSGLTLDEGTTKTIGTSALSGADEDTGDGPSSLTFTVTSGPANGTLLVGGAAATSFTQQDLADGAVAYQHDGSETTSGDFTFTLTDDEGAGPTGQTFAITVDAQNDAPTISALGDQAIEEDATLGPVSFTVGDPETSASSLTVTAGSDNQTLVPDANITLGGSDANRAIEVEPATNESGTATITVTVDDGAGTNNTATESFVLTVAAVPDLAITDGSGAGLDVAPDVAPGTDDNPVGIFALSAGQSGASFEGVTVQTNAAGREGISAARLYWSTDQTLEPGSDAELGSVATDASSAPSAVSFSGFSQSIPTSARYAIVAIDVAAGATGSGVQLELLAPRDLSVPGGEIAAVNGSAADSFSGLLLSNASAALPVEMAGFEAQASGDESVNLQWQTVSETGNAGFDVQRRENEAWATVGFVKSRAEGGTTTEAQRYRFVDTEVPFGADSLTYRLRQVDTDGSASYTDPVTVARSTVTSVRLLGTSPNPARERATVRLSIPEGTAGGEVRLRLYDVLGRAVRTVAAPAEAGRHALQLDTSRLPSGMYFLRLTAGGTSKTQQVTVVR